ncbi:MAG TPA: diadenylate cyclase, partial [Myxococcota bacterium]
MIRELFGGLTLVDLIDMVMVAVLLWSGMLLLRRTRARMALAGLGILGIVYLVARQIGLKVTAGILQGFFAVLVIVVVVVFQDDLRRFFEQIASWGLRRRAQPPPPGVSDLVARTVTRLAASRTGALLVFPGIEDLGPHLEGGISLRGELSEPLLLSLFDASSPGHDGAVVIRNQVLERFAAHL